MKRMMAIAAATLVIGLTSSCMQIEDQPKQVAPVVKRNSLVDPILALRRTINPFLAWNKKEGRNGNRYGLAWTADPRRSVYRQSDPLIRLTELYWHYYYPNTSWLDYPGIEPYLTDTNWGHAAEYGTTLATDITSPGYLDYIASISARNVKNAAAHGVLLDWWHDHHDGGFSEGQVRRSRQSLVAGLRDALGQEAIIIGNVNWHHDKATVSQINGVFLELSKEPYERRSKTLYTRSELFKIESLLLYYEQRLAYPRLIALNGWRQTAAVNDLDRNTPANRQMAKIMTAMSVVIPAHGYILYGDNNPDTDYEDDHHHLYYDFYSFDVGQPTSSYQRVSRGAGFKEHEQGFVAYNITTRDIVFTTSDGREITAPANSGLFCEYVGNSERCLSED